MENGNNSWRFAYDEGRRVARWGVQWEQSPPHNSETLRQKFLGLSNRWCRSQRKTSLKINDTALDTFSTNVLVEPDETGMPYQLSMINRTLCVVQVLGNSHPWPTLTWGLSSVWKLVIIKYKLVSNYLQSLTASKNKE